jgi:hypothetical protein
VKQLKPLKPYMLRRWRIGKFPNCHYLFTCARPGKDGNPASKYATVSNETVHRWVLRLPGQKAALVSLVGCKPDGQSEFSFYSFYGGFDREAENAGRMSFQQWLDRWHGDLAIVLREHPTWDFRPVPTEVLSWIAEDVMRQFLEDRVVIIFDSGGQTRTGQVCKYLGAVESAIGYR